MPTSSGSPVRRIDPNQGDQIYAMVVPGSARAAAERVPKEVRELLKIQVIFVAEDGPPSNAPK